MVPGGWIFIGHAAWLLDRGSSAVARLAQSGWMSRVRMLNFVC